MRTKRHDFHLKRECNCWREWKGGIIMGGGKEVGLGREEEVNPFAEKR